MNEQHAQAHCTQTSNFNRLGRTIEKRSELVCCFGFGHISPGKKIAKEKFIKFFVIYTNDSFIPFVAKTTGPGSTI